MEWIKIWHIIFMVTWFAGLFYMPRLVIYLIEANDKPALEKNAIQEQLNIMLKRLWLGITWPSAIITLIMGIVVTWSGDWYTILFKKEGFWFLLKIIFVLLLYAYHYSLHILYKQCKDLQFPYTSQQIRYWNEVPTIILIAVVFLIVVKQTISVFWGLIGIVGLLIVAAVAKGKTVPVPDVL